MAQRDLKVVVSAKDEASSKLAKMNKSIQSGLKKTAIVAAAMGAALTLAVKKSVDAFMAQERAEKRLEQLTRQTTNATDEQIKSLKEQASALQQVGVIGDEVTIFGQSQLATFALQTDAIEKLTPAMLDMAASIKGVNTTQEDMINIGNMVGKVMGGQVGALSRVGVTFSEAQAEILKTGTEMEKAATLAEILEGNFGGLNKALAETSEGQLQQLKNSWGDMLEQIGEAVIPMLIDLMNQIKPVVDNLMNWISNNKELVGQIIKWSAIILPLLVILPLLTTAIGAVGTVMAFVAANPIVLIIAGITALIASIVLLIKNWDTAKVKIAEVWEKIKQAIFIQLEAIKILLIQFADWFLKIFFGVSLEEAVAAWRFFWDGMKQVAQMAVDFIMGIIEKIVGTILKVIQKLDELKERAKAGLSAAGGAIKGAAGKVAGVFRAQGGNVFPGQRVVVGEKGPEEVIFGKSGRVVPNNRLGGGGTVININLSGNTMLSDAPEVAEKIGDMIIGQLRLQTRLS
jgi:hypothetical protein